MSEIQRYTPHHTGHSHLGTTMAPATIPAPSGYVLFTDHEAAIEELQQMRRTLHANHEYKDARIAELEAEREQVLADAKARIEGLLENGHNTGSQDWYFNEGLREALAALTQPQTEIEGKPDGTWYDIPDGGGAATEKCPNPDCEGGTRPNGEGGWDMCPDCLEAANADGGGAAVAAGARGADLEGDEPSETEAVARVKAVMKAGRDAGSGVFDSNSVFRFGTHGVAALLNFLERDGWEVIHTGVYAQPQKWIQAEAELEDQPTPYAEAFRERVCPVPEFPGIEKEES